VPCGGTYVDVLPGFDDFRAYHNFASLAIKLVETKIHLVFLLLVNHIIVLALLLLVAMTSVEREPSQL
jgi:hypothetical protein